MASHVPYGVVCVGRKPIAVLAAFLAFSPRHGDKADDAVCLSSPLGQREIGQNPLSCRGRKGFWRITTQ